MPPQQTIISPLATFIPKRIDNAPLASRHNQLIIGLTLNRQPLNIGTEYHYG